MFLEDLTWPRNIRTHHMFLGLADLANEHKSCCVHARTSMLAASNDVSFYSVTYVRSG
jgi:hypothetical protein